jgi:hypothetical protein
MKTENKKRRTSTALGPLFLFPARPFGLNASSTGPAYQALPACTPYAPICGSCSTATAAHQPFFLLSEAWAGKPGAPPDELSNAQTEFRASRDFFSNLLKVHRSSRIPHEDRARAAGCWDLPNSAFARATCTLCTLSSPPERALVELIATVRYHLSFDLSPVVSAIVLESYLYKQAGAGSPVVLGFLAEAELHPEPAACRRLDTPCPIRW